MQECGKQAEAYLTIYLAMSMTVMLSLCLTLIEGVRCNAIRLETECITDIGLNSIMAEYHRELLEQYNLFAIDSSYGTAMTGKANTERHLRKYLECNLSLEDIFLSDWWYRDLLGISLTNLELTKVSILTDEKGNTFRRRAAEAAWDDAELALLEQLTEWVRVVKSNQLEERDIAGEKQEIDRKIQEYDGTLVQISENGWSQAKIENPTKGLEENRRKGILKLVIEDTDAVSTNAISSQNLIAARMKQGITSIGNMIYGGAGNTERKIDTITENFFFWEYLLSYMGHFGREKENSALEYQLEYLISGEENDTDNLKNVANRLLILRETANAIYLFSDSEKCMEAELVATAVAALLMVPEIEKLLEVSLLLGWAYAESLYDVKTLLAGGKIPLIKDAGSWHYGLQNALKTERINSSSDKGEGLSYQDYLRIFLACMNQETLTGRAMNMVEADIRMTPGNGKFRLDGCFDAVEASLKIRSSYGYEYEITRQKIY